MDIASALDHYIREGQVPPSKINLGLGAYGRSWTLANAANTAVGSAAYAAGPAGPCTGGRRARRGAAGPALML